MIQLWLFPCAIRGFLAPRHRGWGLLLAAGLQVMLRHFTRCCSDHLKRVLMTQDRALSTEGMNNTTPGLSRKTGLFCLDQISQSSSNTDLNLTTPKNFENSSLWEVGDEVLKMFQWARTQNWINSYSKVWWQGRSNRYRIKPAKIIQHHLIIGVKMHIYWFNRWLFKHTVINLYCDRSNREERQNLKLL